MSDALTKDGFGLDKSSRLDSQRQPEQYSPRLDFQLNPSFPYRLLPFNPFSVLVVSTEMMGDEKTKAT